jgi:hypothetical protein
MGDRRHVKPLDNGHEAPSRERAGRAPCCARHINHRVILEVDVPLCRRERLCVGNPLGPDAGAVVVVGHRVPAVHVAVDVQISLQIPFSERFFLVVGSRRLRARPDHAAGRIGCGPLRAVVPRFEHENRDPFGRLRLRYGRRRDGQHHQDCCNDSASCTRSTHPHRTCLRRRTGPSEPGGFRLWLLQASERECAACVWAAAISRYGRRRTLAEVLGGVLGSCGNGS